VTKVPVGMYAKEALEKLGAWQAAAPKFVMMHHDRAALTSVAVGEARLGIVFETDAKISPYVRIIGTFPADCHSPIVYPVAATVTAKPEAVYPSGEDRGLTHERRAVAIHAASLARSFFQFQGRS